MTWTDAELKKMADDYFRLDAATCPADNSRVNVHELTFQRGTPTMVNITCGACGRHGAHKFPPNVTPYTKPEQHAMIAAGQANRRVECPGDGTPMVVKRLPGTQEVTGDCRRCGRFFPC